MSNSLKVIILVGHPGCGKSTWAKQYYDQLLHIDGDSLHTSARVAKAVGAGLQQGRNVIVDATNVTLERRRDIILQAQRYQALVYGVVFRVPLTTCMERSKKRESEGGVHIPSVAFWTSNSRYVEPTLEEGFTFIGSVE